MVMGSVLANVPLASTEVMVVAVLLIYRHQANIKKILAGTESKLGAKAKP